MISPDSLDLHGQDYLRTDTCGINPGSSTRSEFSPDGDNDDDSHNNLRGGTGLILRLGGSIWIVPSG